MSETGQSTAHESPNEHSITHPKILLVDDDATLLEFYEAVLSSEYEILTAHNIGTAQLFLQEQSVDAVACDFNLTDAKGLDLLLWIQKNQPELLPHSIILSGELSLDLGDFNTPVLYKPFNADGLKQACKALLESPPGEIS